MKTLCFLFLLTNVITVSCCAQRIAGSHTHPNKIDSLSTVPQVEAFVRSIVPADTGLHISQRITFTKPVYQAMADTMPYTPYMKTDLDGNGYTDMLVVASWQKRRSIYCIIDSGQSRYSIRRIMPAGWPDFAFPIMKPIGRNTAIIFRTLQISDQKDGTRKMKSDTLLYLYGGFIEVNHNPSVYKINSVSFHVESFWSDGPFDASVDSAGMVKVSKQILRNRITDDHKGTLGSSVYKDSIVYRGILDKPTHVQLLSLLNYMNFAGIDSFAGVSAYDVPDGTLHIKYNDGLSKGIFDNWLQRSYALRRVYQILFDLPAHSKPQ